MSEPLRREVEIFNAALEMTSQAERGAYVAQACAGDEGLRRKVEALLQAHAGAEGFFQTAKAGPSPGGTVLVACPVLEKVGDKIGRYKLLQEIGEGGCGVVYMAEQQEPIRRKVAFKVIKLGMDTKQVIGRFEAERQALALMDHPNIARVLDAGATATGRPYFVMELVRGIKITDYCDQNNLATDERLRLFIQVCHAIQHAHQKGIIHRDIKPSNILVTVNDGVPVPKVIDFGIAKATGGQVLTDKTLFTAFEQFIGTPAYMSPEQAEMTSLDIDTRSDIYALGVLLYELLTGHTPFDPQTLLSAGMDQMRRIIREKEPLRPSTRLSSLDEAERTTVAKRRHSEPPRLIHELCGDLDWIVMKCLEKDRTRRYETANNLAMDIEHHLNQQPVSAVAPSTLYRAGKFARRHKVGLAMAGLIVLLLAIGTVVSTWQAVRATRAEAKERFQRGRAERLRATAETALYKARLSENRALRLARPPGWSELSLANLSSNVAMGLPQRNLVELRGEAVAGLEELDVREVARWPGHTNGVWSLDFGRQGELLASADRNGIMRVRHLGQNAVFWEREDSAATRGFIPNPKLAPYPAVRFDPSGEHLAYSTWNHSVEVVSMRNPGQVTWQVSGPGQAHYLGFDRKGDILAVAWSDARVVAYETATGKTLQEIRLPGPARPGWREVVAISPDGTVLAVAGDGHTVELRQVASNVPPVVLGRHQDSLMSLAFSQAGNLLASASTDHTAKLFDVAAGKERFTLTGHQARVQCVSFRNGGRIIATASDDQTVRLWDARTGQTIMVLRPEIGPALTVAFSPDGRQLAVASNEAIALYHLANEGAKQVLFGHNYQVLSLAFHPAKPLLASASGDNSIRLWNLATGETEKRLPGHPRGQPRGLAFSPDGELLAAGHWGYINYRPTNHDIHVWGTASGSLRETFPGHNTEVGCVAFDPSGKLLASGDNQGVTLVRDCATGDSEQQWQHTNARVIGLRFSSPEHLVMAHRCGHLRLADCRTGQIIAEAKGSDKLTALALAPAQSRLAVGSERGAIEFFALPALSRVATVEAGPGNADAVSFSADGRLLASGGDQAQVTLWDARTGRELLKLPRQESPIFDLAFEPSGSHLAISGVEEQITVWDLAAVRERLKALRIDWE